MPQVQCTTTRRIIALLSSHIDCQLSIVMTIVANRQSSIAAAIQLIWQANSADNLAISSLDLSGCNWQMLAGILVYLFFSEVGFFPLYYVY